ncbi:MAG: prephenate dehydratase [Planctomycetaceae bacterium]|nr:prephenate dehydratase [Planctomycetaceae bacterium]
MAKKTARAKAKKASAAKSAKKKKLAKKKVAKKGTKKVAKKARPRSSGGTGRSATGRSSETPEAALRRLDRDIVKLITRRADLTTKAILKSKNPNKAVFEPHGDDELWVQLEKYNTGSLPSHAVRGVFREILSAARRAVRTQRVAYLGPPYSFTHLAAIDRFGKSADLVPVSTIAAVFEEVNRGLVEFGIVPIENSTDGRIVDTLDMFTRLPIRICGEVQISVHHNLLARCPRGEIVEIYSKPQALSQCREWLSRNMPHARLIEVTSTSTAAQLARDKPGVGAVASQQAAVEYDLQIVAGDIQDNKNNVTRFAVIGDETSKPTGKDRTALLLQISHKPGALSDALVAFKKNKVNLSWIESFPLRGPETGYLFFLDFEGHMQEARTKRTLSELEKNAVRLEILGSYPRSEPID